MLQECLLCKQAMMPCLSSNLFGSMRHEAPIKPKLPFSIDSIVGDNKDERVDNKNLCDQTKSPATPQCFAQQLYSHPRCVTMSSFCEAPPANIHFAQVLHGQPDDYQPKAPYSYSTSCHHPSLRAPLFPHYQQYTTHHQWPSFSPLNAISSHSFYNEQARKGKRIRTAFTASQLIQLEKIFEKNQYVVGTDRKQLAKELGLTETQIKVWFQNRRTKFKRVKLNDSRWNDT